MSRAIKIRVSDEPAGRVRTDADIRNRPMKQLATAFEVAESSRRLGLDLGLTQVAGEHSSRRRKREECATGALSDIRSKENC